MLVFFRHRWDLLPLLIMGLHMFAAALVCFRYYLYILFLCISLRSLLMWALSRRARVSVLARSTTFVYSLIKGKNIFHEREILTADLKKVGRMQYCKVKQI